MLRIGLLLPRSTLYPTLGLDLLYGFKEQLRKQGLYDQVKLITDNIGFGIDEQEIYTKAERMLLQEDADIVMLCADTGITEMLQPLFAASNKILLVVNFGANIPESWQAAATTLTHSLNFAEQASITGKLAATENAQKETNNLVSYFDGGYRQCYCMLTANQAAGGLPVFNHITSLRVEEFTLEPVATFLQEHPEAKNMLCLFSGDQALSFYKAIAPLQKENDLRLYGAPMLFEPALKGLLGDDFEIGSIRGYIPWHASLDHAANAEFIKLPAFPGKMPNYFSLLGWEAGILVTEIAGQHQSGTTDAVKIIAAMTAKTLESPRGWLTIDPRTHYSYGPCWLARCEGNMNITIEGEADAEEEWKTFSHQRSLKGEASGWRNTYLCI